MIARLIFAAGIAYLPAPAATITFDFEDETTTSPPRTGALTSLVVTESGLTMTITRGEFGNVFDLVANVGTEAGKPASFGSVSLDPFFIDASNTPFIINFSEPVVFFSVRVGDYGGDVLDMLSLQAFSEPNLGGVLVDASSTVGPATFPSSYVGLVSSGSLAPDAIRSIRMIGGTSSFPNSVYYDNITVETVPEPSTIALTGGIGGGLVALGRWRRSRARSRR